MASVLHLGQRPFSRCAPESRTRKDEAPKPSTSYNSSKSSALGQEAVASRCRYLKIGVWDKFGEEKINSTDQPRPKYWAASFGFRAASSGISR